MGVCICHPERSEGSPIAQNKPERNEILRLSAQNNNASVGGIDAVLRCRGGSPCPPVDFDVICPSVTRFARATSPTSGEVFGTVKTVPYTHEMHFTG